MGIHHIAHSLIHTADNCRRLFLTCISSIEVSKLLSHNGSNLIAAILGQLLHQSPIRLVALIRNLVNQPLQITGNQDIHRGRAGQQKLPVTVIAACPKEIIQHLIVIGGADQLSNRKPHLLRIVSRQNISEIARWNHYIDRLIFPNLTIRKEPCISIHIIYNLRNQTSDVNGVGRGKAIALLRQLFLESSISENRFHTALCIIKIAPDSHHEGIVPLLGHHLLLLNGAHAILGIKYNNPRPRHIRKACQSRLSRIPGGGRQNHNIFLHLILPGGNRHQMRQNRKCHILKCNGRPMKQLQIISPLRLGNGRNLGQIKLAVISLCYTILKLAFRKIRQKTAHHRIGHLLVAHVRQLLHTYGKGRNRLRDK